MERNNPNWAIYSSLLAKIPMRRNGKHKLSYGVHANENEIAFLLIELDPILNEKNETYNEC